MQDHASHWTHLAPLDGDSHPQRPTRALLPRLRRAVAAWPSSPVLTGVILLASTLCAAAPFLCMLPTVGRTSPYPSHAIVTPQPEPLTRIAPALAPAPALGAGPTARAEAPALPSMVTRFAVAAGH